MASSIFLTILDFTVHVTRHWLLVVNCRDQSLSALEAHLALFLSQAQAEAHRLSQEALFLVLGRGSQELWGLGQPVTHPFAD